MKLGEDGATTLAENVAALPAERYRVEKYLVSDPADVDVDCTDDITELNDLGRMNPVNPARTIRRARGAVAVPDQKMFERLAIPYRNGTSMLKFVLINMDTDSPSVYFINVNRFEYHNMFLSRMDIDQRDATAGLVMHDPDFVVLDGSRGAYHFGVSNQIRSFNFLDRAHTVVAASMPVLDDNLSL